MASSLLASFLVGTNQAVNQAGGVKQAGSVPLPSMWQLQLPQRPDPHTPFSWLPKARSYLGNFHKVHTVHG